MTTEMPAQETAATLPPPMYHQHYTCPHCKREIVHVKGRGWIHRDDSTPYTYHEMQLRMFPRAGLGR